MSQVLKNKIQEKKKNRYNTANLSLLDKCDEYEKKYAGLKILKKNHKDEINTLKACCSSSIGVLNFKLDEMTKKMKSDIRRLKDESNKQNEVQNNENNKIKVQVGLLKESCHDVRKLLKETLERVENVEKNIGTSLELPVNRRRSEQDKSQTEF